MSAPVLYTLIMVTFGGSLTIQKDLSTEPICQQAASLAKTGATVEHNARLDREYEDWKARVKKADDERRAREAADPSLKTKSFDGLVMSTVGTVYGPDEEVITVRGAQVKKRRSEVRETSCLSQSEKEK